MSFGTTQPIPASVASFKVYREGQALESGIVDLKLPDIACKTQEITGAGLSGTIESVMPYIEAMTATIKWRTLHEDQFALMQQLQQHGLIFRLAQQIYDAGQGGPAFDGVSIRMKAQGKKLGAGTAAPVTATDTEVELAVHYLKMERNDGFVLLEADPVGNVLIINGEDQLATLRSLL